MQIEIKPLNAMVYKLASANSGFNYNLEQVALPIYGINPFTIAFPATALAPATKSFQFGQFDENVLEEESSIASNRFHLYVVNTANQNFEKPRNFSGLVQIGLDVCLSWKGSLTKTNHLAYSLAVTDALAETFLPWGVTNWGSGVVFNGSFGCFPKPIESAGNEDYRQVLVCRLAFQVDI